MSFMLYIISTLSLHCHDDSGLNVLILGRNKELGKVNWTVSELIIVHLIFTAILMYSVWKAIS